MLRQCAAVRTCLSVIMTPPQKGNGSTIPDPFFLRLTMNVYSSRSALRPPTILLNRCDAESAVAQTGPWRKPEIRHARQRVQQCFVGTGLAIIVQPFQSPNPKLCFSVAFPHIGRLRPIIGDPHQIPAGFLPTVCLEKHAGALWKTKRKK